MNLKTLLNYFLLLYSVCIWWNCSENPSDVSGTTVGTENTILAEVEINSEDIGTACPSGPGKPSQMNINVRPAASLPGNLDLPDSRMQSITLDSIGAFRLVLKSGTVFFLEIEAKKDIGCGTATWLGWFDSIKVDENKDTINLGNIRLRYPGGQVNGKFSFSPQTGETIYIGFPGTQHILELTSEMPFSFPQVPEGSWDLQIIRWSEVRQAPKQIILLSDVLIERGVPTTLEWVDIDSLGMVSCTIPVLPDGTLQRSGGVISCQP